VWYSGVQSPLQPDQAAKKVDACFGDPTEEKRSKAGRYYR